jgi:thioredoxin 1
MNATATRICPSCRQSDYTDFSTCRFCHTRYDAVVPNSKGSSGYENMIYVCALILLLVVAGVFSTYWARAEHAKALASITAPIKAANRTTVYEFYADWCGPCRAYGPIVEASRARYQGSVDFVRYNVDDAQSQPLARKLGVQSIPATFIFNRSGELVGQLHGGVDQATLDDAVQQALR